MTWWIPKQIRPSDVDTMLGLLTLEPLSLRFGKQPQELIDLLFGRAHLERAGLDADQRHAEGVGMLLRGLSRGGLRRGP